MVNYYIGIDPGIGGALAVICTKVDFYQKIFDMPVYEVRVGKTIRRVVDWKGVSEFFKKYQNGFFCIEDSKPRPRDGSSAGHGTGRGFGGLEALVAVYDVKVHYVPPVKWKRRFNLLKQTKDASRKKAIELFPDAACDLHLKKHHGRAEAILIAEYGRMVRENNE